MAGNLESRVKMNFFRRTARNIGLGIGAVVLALASGCASQKDSSKSEYVYTPDYDVVKNPDSRYKKTEKSKQVKPFEIGISLGEGNSYSFIGGKLSGFLNVDRHSTFELGISYGFAPMMLPHGVVIGKFVTNGSAGFHYKIMDEQSLFLRVFGGVQGAGKVYDDCGHITSFEDMYGGGLLVGTRFASAEGVFIDIGLGASIVRCPAWYRKKYTGKGSFDVGFGFKFG